MVGREEKTDLKDKIMNRQKSSKQLSLEDTIADKNILEIDDEQEDITSLTVLSYLAINEKRFMIHPEKRA